MHTDSHPLPAPGAGALAQGMLWLFIASLSALLGCALASRNIYLQDLPEWVLQSALTTRYLAGDEAVIATYRLVPYPIPNSLFQVLQGLLAVVLGDTLATKVFVVLYSAAFLTLCWKATARFGSEGQVLRTIILAKLLVFGIFYWMGTVNFLLGLLLLSTYLHLEHGEERLRPGRILLFSLAIFVAHAIPLMLFGPYITVRALLRRRVAALLALVPSGLLVVWYVVGRTQDAAGFHKGRMGVVLQDATQAPFLLAKLSHLVKVGPFANLRLPDNGTLLPLPLYLLFIGLSIACLGALFLGFAARWRTQGPWAWRMVGVMGVGLVVPPNMLGVYSIDSRFFMVGLLLLLFFCELPPAALRFSAALCLVLALHTNVWMIHHARFNPEVDKAVPRELDPVQGFRDKVADQFFFSISAFGNHYAYDALEHRRLQRLFFDTAMLTHRVRPRGRAQSPARQTAKQATGPAPTARR